MVRFVVTGVTLVLAATALGSLPATAWGADGDLDKKYGVKVTHPDVHDSYGRAIEVLPNGKFLIAGESKSDLDDTNFAVMRYTPQGKVDKTFANNGKAIIPVGFSWDVVYDMQIQSDGKIVLAGSSSGVFSGRDFAVVRLNPNGSLDTSFGNGGKVTTDFGGQVDQAYSLGLDSQGRMVLSGFATIFGKRIIAAARYTSSGQLDTSFSGDGRFTLDVGKDRSIARDLVVLKNNKIVLAGYAETDTGEYLGPKSVGVIARLTASGQLDGSFSGGKRTFGVAGRPVFTQTAVLTQGGGVVLGGILGRKQLSQYRDSFLVKYNAKGKLATSFAGDGKRVANMGTDTDGIYDLIEDSDGTLVAAGEFHAASRLRLMIARFNKDGSTDRGFGDNGRTWFRSKATDQTAFAVAVQPGRGYLVSGYSRSPGGLYNGFMSARFKRAAGAGSGGMKITKISKPGKVVRYVEKRKVAGKAQRAGAVDVAIRRVNNSLLRKKQVCLWVHPPTGRYYRVKAKMANGDPKCRKRVWFRAQGAAKWKLGGVKLKRGKYVINARALAANKKPSKIKRKKTRVR